MSRVIKENQTVLFIGDSVTDCGRAYDQSEYLGEGYAKYFAEGFTSKYPKHNVTFLNRGISGNRSIDIKNRWMEDCINLEPDFLSVLIGINDTWRRYDANDPTSAELFYETCRENMLKLKSVLPNTKILILEPFLMPFPEGIQRMREDLDPKIAMTRKIAREFADFYIPLDGIFASYAVSIESAKLSGDGVHPTSLGHRIIADQIMRTCLTQR